MGFLPGTAVTVQKIAPFGDPIAVSLRGCVLSLRRQDAQQIELIPQKSTGRCQTPSAAPAGGQRDALRQRFSVSGQAAPAVRPVPVVALAGNPNCGKTTLFNALTGSDQHVGNWPGVTVEKQEGIARYQGRTCRVVDLPGCYSLSSGAAEEQAASSFLTCEAPDVVVNLVDAVHLERNLFLTLQLLDVSRPMVLAVNFMDELKARGGALDLPFLSDLLHTPVIPIVARTGKNLNRLLAAIWDQCCRPSLPARLQAPSGRLPDGLLGADTALARYCVLSDLVSAILVQPPRRDAATARIDRAVTGTYTALPLFLAAMGLLFFLIFGPVGAGLRSLVDGAFAGWMRFFAGLLSTLRCPAWLAGLVLDGALAGLGSVLSFLPQLALLFLCLSFLEDCGYLSRAAFLMDRPMRLLGLSGKAFIPLLLGFGCTVPAILATRTLDTDRNRTIRLLPFVSCSAKLPVYSLLASTFFGSRSWLVILALYLTGLLSAAGLGLILHRRWPDASGRFLLELPPYRLPSPAQLLSHVWRRLSAFVKKAASLIVLMSILLWLLAHFNLTFSPVSDPQASMLAALSGIFAPLLRPCGFGSWRAAVALLTGLVAKEAVVSSLRVLYGLGSPGVSAAAALADFRPLSALSFLLFVLLYVPCAATLSAARQARFPRVAGLALQQLGTAFLLSALLYQAGCLLGF